jgi:hypothetical protein
MNTVNLYRGPRSPPQGALPDRCEALAVVALAAPLAAPTAFEADQPLVHGPALPLAICHDNPGTGRWPRDCRMLRAAALRALRAAANMDRSPSRRTRRGRSPSRCTSSASSGLAALTDHRQPALQRGGAGAHSAGAGRGATVPVLPPNLPPNAVARAGIGQDNALAGWLKSGGKPD